MQAAASTLSPASIHKEQVVAENAWKGLHLCRLHVDVCTMVRERSMPGPKNFTFLYYDVLGTLRSYNAQTVWNTQVSIFAIVRRFVDGIQHWLLKLSSIGSAQQHESFGLKLIDNGMTTICNRIKKGRSKSIWAPWLGRWQIAECGLLFCVQHADAGTK